MSNTDLIPLDFNSLATSGAFEVPEHLRKLAEVTGVNAADMVMGGGFPVMSIKGKNWTLKRDGEAKIQMNPLDPNSPASAIEVVIVRASNVVTKTYYQGSYTDGSEDKPTCFSNDGQLPSKDSAQRQAASCAECPWNQWGSRQNADGTKSDGKACQDNKRLAIAAASAINDPIMLRIPPSSFRAMTSYANLLGRKNIPYNAVVTKLRFNPEAPTPELMFEPVGLLQPAQAEAVAEQYDSPLVQEIVGLLDIDRANMPTDAEKAAAAASAHTSAMARAEQETAAAGAMAQAEATATAAEGVTDPRAMLASVTDPIYWVHMESHECGVAPTPAEAQVIIDSGCRVVDKAFYDRFVAAKAAAAQNKKAEADAAAAAAQAKAEAEAKAKAEAEAKAKAEAEAKAKAEAEAKAKAEADAAAAAAATEAVAGAVADVDPEMAALLSSMEGGAALEVPAQETPAQGEPAPANTGKVEKTLPNVTEVSGATLDDAMSMLDDLGKLGLDN